MKNEKFLKSLSGIDKELVENVRKDIEIWQQANEGVSVAPAPRKSHWKMITASVVGSAAVLCGGFALMSNVGMTDRQYSPAAANEESAVTDSITDSNTESGETNLAEQATPWKTSSLPKITTEIMCWEDDLVYDVLADNYPFFKEQRSDQFYPDLTATLWCEKGEDGVTRLYLDNTPTHIHYRTPDNLDYSSFFNHHDFYYDNPKIKYSDVLDGFTKEDAIQRAKETAEKFGITNLGEPAVFALKAENANAYSEYCIEKFGRDELKEGPYVPWTKDDEAYFITFPLMFEETPMVSYQTSVYKTASERDARNLFLGASIRVIVTKDRIVGFEATEIFKPEYTVGESVNINFSKDDIIKKVIAENPRDDQNGVETVYNCELVYTPVEKTDRGFVFVPAWQIDYGTRFTYDDPETGETVRGDEVHRTVVYNAETGEYIDMYPDNISLMED